MVYSEQFQFLMEYLDNPNEFKLGIIRNLCDEMQIGETIKTCNFMGRSKFFLQEIKQDDSKVSLIFKTEGLRFTFTLHIYMIQPEKKARGRPFKTDTPVIKETNFSIAKAETFKFNGNFVIKSIDNPFGFKWFYDR